MPDHHPKVAGLCLLKLVRPAKSRAFPTDPRRISRVESRTRSQRPLPRQAPQRATKNAYTSRIGNGETPSTRSLHRSVEARPRLPPSTTSSDHRRQAATSSNGLLGSSPDAKLNTTNSNTRYPASKPPLADDHDHQAS